MHSKSLQLCPTPLQQEAPLSIGFTRQEYWSMLLYALARDASHLGINLSLVISLASAGMFFTTTSPGKHQVLVPKYYIWVKY